MVDVILIHCPTTMNAKKYAASFHSMDKIGYGMLHIASFLSKNGYNVQIWDVPELYRQGYSEKYLEKCLKKSSPIVVGVELNWMHQSLGAIETARMAKKTSPGTPVLVGGTHATILAEEIASRYSDCVDAVLKGEAEISFLECVKKIEEGKSIDDVGGVVRKSGEKIINNPIERIVEDIDEIPPYTLKKTNGESPVVLGHPSPDVYTPAVNVCRGPCYRRCIYCIGPRISEFSGRRQYTTHSPKWVIDQMRLLVEGGYTELYIQDWTYLSGRKTIESIADAMIQEGLNEEIEHLNLVAAPGFLKGGTLAKLGRAGVDTIDYGMETGSQRILSLLKREVTIQQMKDSVKLAVKAGIVPQTWWMTGFPDETWEDVRETARLIKETIELGGLPFWVTPLIVEPGTELFDQAEQYGLTLRMRSFEDYMVFSTTPLRKLAWYPELITHETRQLGTRDILKASFLLRMLIYRRREEMLSRIPKMHRRFDSEEVVNHIRLATNRILFTVF